MKEKDEIIRLMFQLGISYPELAAGTHIQQHKLYYVLHCSSKSLPIEIYTRIMSYLDKRGALSIDHIDSTDELIPAAFRLNSLVSEFMTRVNMHIEDVIKNGVITTGERLTLKQKLSSMRDKLDEQIALIESRL